MKYASRLLASAGFSVALHFSFARALDRIPPTYETPRPENIQVRVVAPPPEPEPEKVEATPEPAPQEVLEPPKAGSRPRNREPTSETPPTTTTAVEHPGAPSDAPPIFGINLESTSPGGRGPAMPVGNTVQPGAPTAPASAAKPTGSPVAAYEVTKMPLPMGRCTGHYTEQARSAGLEGTVVLDLVVDDTGRATGITVAQSLGQGLDEAAVTALKNCRFQPGERDGKPVAVRVRGFKIRFFLSGGE